MKKINYPLLLGILIVAFLMSMFLFPDFYTDKDPLYEESPKYIEVRHDGEWVETFSHNPMPPNKDNIMGTDDAGRDVYARLIYGAKNTLTLVFMIAIFRMLIAFPIGLAAGMGIKVFSWLIRVLNTFFTAVPILILSFLILNFSFFKSLHMDQAIFYYAIVLTILGWAKLAGIIEDSVKRIMEQDFIEGEIAIGKTSFQIARQNVLPHILPNLVSLFFKEIGLAMFLLAQLAVFRVFVGVSRRVKELAFRAAYEMILEPEWGGTLSRIAYNMRNFDEVYWMTLYPIILFSLSIVGFNLVGEGLRIEFQKKNSHLISHIRKGYFAISPKVFISQIKSIRTYYKPVIAKTLVFIMIIAAFTVQWNPSQYDFDMHLSLSHLEELTSASYQGRASGTEGGYLAGDYIADQLRSFGYDVEIMEIPYEEKQDYTPQTFKDGKITLVTNEGIEETFYLNQDFAILTVGRETIKEDKDRLVYTGFATSPENGSFLTESSVVFPVTTEYVRVQDFSRRGQNIVNISRKLSLSYEIEFVMNQMGSMRPLVPMVFNSTTIIPGGRLYEILMSGPVEMTIDLAFPESPKYNGRNIIGTLYGENDTPDEPGQQIIIGATYDGLYKEGEDQFAISATPSAIALESARVLSTVENPFNKTIQFVFWDNQFGGSLNPTYTGIGQYHLKEKRDIEMALGEGFYYLDIGYPSPIGQETLSMTTMPAQRANGKSYLIGLEMEKRLKEMKIEYKRFHYDYGASFALNYMRLNSTTSVGIGESYVYGMNTSYDTADQINYEHMETIGQLVVDTITMIPHIMLESDKEVSK